MALTAGFSTTESSTGSNIFAIVSIFVISAFVLLLLRHFLPLRTTPAHLLVPIFFSLALPISIILLVPIDLASSSRTSDEASRGIWLPEWLILRAWRITYWLTFALTWLILPLLGEYMDSGFRTPRDSMLYSLRSNARYQLIVLSCGTIGLVYVFVQHGFEGTSVKSLIMALAYCWGLIQAIYLMGHGLVAVPRRLFRNASIIGRLRRIQTSAPKLYDKLEESITDLNTLEQQLAQLKQRKNGISRDHQLWVKELADTPDWQSARLSAISSPQAAPGAPIPAVITDGYLADLSRNLNRARHKRMRFTKAWDRLVQEAADTQAILDASSSQQLYFGKASPSASFFERVNILTPYTRYLLYSKVAPVARIILAGLLTLSSVCIIWSELVKSAAPKLSIISYTVVLYTEREQDKVTFAGQVTASLWLLYMCAAALASFDEVKVWGNRALVRRNTYGESACWYAGQIAKLTVPLAFNFVTFLPASIHRKTTFYHFLGSLIVLTPLGKWFDVFFPMFVLVPVCATFFNLYGRAKNVLGLGYGIVEDDDDEDDNPTGYGTGGWREGRDMIASSLVGRSNLESPTPLDGPLSASHTRIMGSRRDGEGLSSTTPGSSRGQPTLYIPPAQRAGNSRLQAQHLSAAAEATEEQDESVFAGFAHRVRNTIDSVETPDWLGKRPRWMGGIDGNAETSGRAESGRGLGRWFGGRPGDGQVRL